MTPGKFNKFLLFMNFVKISFIKWTVYNFCFIADMWLWFKKISFSLISIEKKERKALWVISRMWEWDLKNIFFVLILLEATICKAVIAVEHSCSRYSSGSSSRHASQQGINFSSFFNIFSVNIEEAPLPKSIKKKKKT